MMNMTVGRFTWENGKGKYNESEGLNFYKGTWLDIGLLWCADFIAALVLHGVLLENRKFHVGYLSASISPER